MSTIIVASTTTASAESPSATTAAGLGLRFIDLQRPSTEFGAIESSNRLISFGGIRHFDESKTARTACVTIGDHAYLINRTMNLECTAKLSFCCAVRDITYVQILHSSLF
jgi:hypothetical protein